MVGVPNTVGSIWAPTKPKKNGVKRAAIGAVSFSRASRSDDSPTTMPARKAPMMAARPMAALSAARPSMTIIPGRSGVSANRGSVSSDGRRDRIPVPATRTIPMNAAARPRVSRMSPGIHAAAGHPDRDGHDQHRQDVVDDRRAQDDPPGAGLQRAELIQCP